MGTLKTLAPLVLKTGAFHVEIPILKVQNLKLGIVRPLMGICLQTEPLAKLSFISR
jgi:hypothetical protein